MTPSTGKNKNVDSFNAEQQLKDLLEAECLVADAYALCYGFSYADAQLDEARYQAAAAGAFRLLSVALEKAHNTLSTSESTLRKYFGVTYGKGGASA
jgi:hypothetical protein